MDNCGNSTANTCVKAGADEALVVFIRLKTNALRCSPGES